MKRWMAIFFILIFTGLVARAGAETILLSGSHTVTYDIINPRGLKNLPEYSNQNYSQKIISGDRVSKKVRVEIRLSPLPPSGPFPFDPGSLAPELRPFLASEEDIPSDNSRMIEIAKKITQGSAGATEAYNRIINWVMDTLEYEINTPQDAISVFKNKKGSCVGFSNLSLTLLRASGFPARYVSGYLPPGYDWGISKDYWGVKTSGGGFHAWIEVYLPQVGWVFTDTQHSKTFVDPFHLLLGIRGLNIGDNVPREGEYIAVDNGTSFTVAEEENRSELVDSLPAPGKKLLGRVEIGAQTRARVVATIADPSGKGIPGSELVLWQGQKGTVNKANDDGIVYLIGLDQGDYNVTFQAPGFAARKEKISLPPGTTRKIQIQLEEGGEVSGKVEDLSGQPLGKAKIFVWKGAVGTGYPVESNGQFRLRNLPLGEAKLSAQADGFIDEDQKVAIRHGGPVQVNFRLEPGGVLKGSVRDQQGKPVKRGKIFIWTGDRGIGYTLKEDGTYLVNGIKPGNYRLSIKSSGFIEEFKDIQIEKGKIYQTDFSLKPKEL
ncbi:MAG: carboxypeptidase regulatory-like domain-containing protein [Proteobacteria bacterium]|nr:carboxypeptidase regulatory-like domain-containing protein [Pseudomonadota bacterium]